MNKLFKVAVAGLMAASLVGCSKSATANTPAAASTAAATAEASEAPVVTEGKYTVTNETGEKVTALYVFKTGSSDKGKNYAEAGLDVGASVDVAVSVSEEEAKDYAMTVEYTTESGHMEDSFKNLHLEEANFSLVKEADLDSSATKQNVKFAHGE